MCRQNNRKMISSERTQPLQKSVDPYSLNYRNLFWVFFIGCFMGVVLESIYFLIAHDLFQIRAGVLYGPFNPIYGFGAIVMTVCLHWLRKKHFLFIFLCSTILGGLFEYLCSAFQELVFGTVSWDYSDLVFNINGRTSLVHALVWGVLGLAWIKWVYRYLIHLINCIPHNFLKIATIVLSIFMAFNMLLSFLAVDRQSERRQGLPSENSVDRFLDEYYPDEFLDEIFLSTIQVP